MDVQRKAQELAEAIISSPEYKRLLEARARVNNQHAAKVMLRDFLNKQLELHIMLLVGR